jgi:DNA-binding NarL/FixJ family response regulator
MTAKKRKSELDGSREMSAPLRILLVEDNAVYREALELLLGLLDDVEVVGSVADGESALSLCSELVPDAVLLDFRLPGLDGVEATKALLERFPQLAVVCLTALASSREREAVVHAGAYGCLTKDEELEEIVETVRRAVEEARRR